MNERMTSAAVCVLGMSRSGTSLTARILSLIGVYLGEEGELLQGELRQLQNEDESVLAAASEANPGGFWEHYELMRLNERVLRRLGGNWREPPSPEPGWHSSGELAPEREEARFLLETSFSGHRLWGWKDPRNSLTLPFWQALVPDLRYVVCLRNPLDVGKSLERRDGLSLELGIALWETYLKRALGHTQDGPRIVVSYESYFEDPRSTVNSLADFVGRPDSHLDREAMEKTIDRRLWRQRSGADRMPYRTLVPASAESLYESTRRLVVGS